MVSLAIFVSVNVRQCLFSRHLTNKVDYMEIWRCIPRMHILIKIQYYLIGQDITWNKAKQQQLTQIHTLLCSNHRFDVQMYEIMHYHFFSKTLFNTDDKVNKVGFIFSQCGTDCALNNNNEFWWNEKSTTLFSVKDASFVW